MTLRMQKMTTTAVLMIGFGLGNALGPQFWLDKYKPANLVPWGLTLMSALVAVAATIVLRTLFARENQRRDIMYEDARRSGRSTVEFEEWAEVQEVDDEGRLHRRRVDKMFLDLTDGENLAFRYVL